MNVSITTKNQVKNLACKSSSVSNAWGIVKGKGNVNTNVNSNVNSALSYLRDKSFIDWNHAIGLPKKDNREFEIFDYELELAHALDTNKSVFIKKARGLGLTEILLRYMAWIATRNNDYSGCRFHIITGPRINLAMELIDRLSLLFKNSNNPVILEQVGPTIDVNGVTIQAFPSHTVSSSRGYTNVKFILVDECAYLPPGQQEESQAVIEGYRLKSDPWIVLVSTPNKPGDYFEKTDSDPNSLFKKLSFHYRVGLNKIYDPLLLEREKNQAYFKREYELFYSVGTGNCFVEQDIEAAIGLGDSYDPLDDECNTSSLYGRVLAIDPGFSVASPLGICITQFKDNRIEVLKADEYDRALQDDVILEVLKLKHKYSIAKGNIFIDASNASLVSSLKYALNDSNWHSYATDENGGYVTSIDDPRLTYGASNHYVLPVVFSKTHSQMLAHTNDLLVARKICINKKFDKLIDSLRTAVIDDKWSLDKTATNHDDILDALRMCLTKYQYKDRNAQPIMISSGGDSYYQ